MRDWTKTLRRASYRGVAFWVDYDELGAGKRLALHEYAGSRVTLVEELGLSTSVFDLTLYLTGDTADAQAKSLAAAMLADGPSWLVLPIDGGMLATAENFRRSRAKDRNGYIGFSASFIPAVNAPGAVLSIGDVASSFANGVAAAASQFARFF